METQAVKVLAVEDDVFLKELLAGRFSSGDFNILHASSGEEAIATAKSEKPNIILLDIILPGMSGFEILEALKADPETASIPVVFLSNLGSDDDIKRGKELGAVDFLIKANNSLDAIVSRIGELVGETSSQGGSQEPVQDELEQDLTPAPEAIEEAESTSAEAPEGSPEAPFEEETPQS